MAVTIPPGEVLLSVRGLRGPDDHAAIRAAIRARDPAALGTAAGIVLALVRSIRR